MNDVVDALKHRCTQKPLRAQVLGGGAPRGAGLSSLLQMVCFGGWVGGMGEEGQ